MAVGDGQGRGPRVLRGHVRLALARDLAAMTSTQTELAAKYGVSQPAISQFIDREQDLIVAIRADMGNELAGLWVAAKAARVAEYERDIEHLNGALGDAEGSDGAPPAPDLLSVKHRALRAVAEELGQLPARMTVKVEGEIRTVIEGIDIADIK
jgi:hypothetical protein